MKQQSGFTLIELIVVIVILGILAATALPRFSNLSVDARIAKMQGVAASLQGASAMAHGQALAENLNAASSITLEGGATVSMVQFYPSRDGIWNAIDTTGVVSNVSGAQIALFYPDQNRRDTASSCYVSYTAASGAGTIPTISTANITTANCS